MKQLEYPICQIVDSSGNPVSGGSVYIYSGNTSDLATVYTDSSLTTISANPITLDSKGVYSVYVEYGKAYSIKVEDSSGSLVFRDSNLLGNLDGTITTTSTVGSIRTVTISSVTVTLSTITSATNSDITITPDTNVLAYFGLSVFTNYDIDTNGYNWNSGSSTSNLSIWPTTSSTGVANSEHSYPMFYFIAPGFTITGGVMTIANAATGNAPSVELTSAEASRAIRLASGYSSSMSGKMIHISGVDYLVPSGSNTYLKTTGAGSTYWEA